MRLLSGIISSLVLSTALSTLSLAQVNASEQQARTVLIEKLLRVHLTMAPNDPTKTGLSLRLADLYAERARLSSMAELDKGCVVCNAGVEDRQKALQLYTEALPKITPAQAGRVLSQIGHLNQLLGQEEKAVVAYKSILEKNLDEEINLEAQLSLAELYFKKRDFTSAESYYKKVITSKVGKHRGLANYRLAWCKFNQGSSTEAVELLKTQLRNPDLLTRGNVSTVDAAFHEEVSRDFVTFLSKENSPNVTGAWMVEEVYRFSPESTRLANAVFLASELERMGQLQKSVDAWDFVMQRQSQPQDRLESQIHLASLKKQQGDSAKAAEHFSQAISLWQTLSCQGENCNELKIRLKNFLIDWNQAEKKNPTVELATAYAKYLSVFSNEVQMWIWAAQVNKSLARYDIALDSQMTAVKISSGEDRENALLESIEIAEVSKDKKLLLLAYSSYLTESKSKKKELEVKYQLAKLQYDAGDYAKASTAMREVALASGAAAGNLKKQAADLALDALVLSKQDSLIEKWSLDFAKAFPEAGAEFKSLARKSVLTQTAQSSGDLLAAWTVLSRFDLVTASDEERVAFYKNRLVLAEKLKKLPEARESAEAIVAMAGSGKGKVSEADYQYALSRKVWLSELILDFAGALTATEKFSASTLDHEQKYLKLAMLADLSGKSSRPYYTEYLKVSKDVARLVAVNAQLVRTATNPMAELELRQKALLQNPEILADLYLEIYAKSKDVKVLDKAVAVKSIATTTSGRVLRRYKMITEWQNLKKDFAAATIDTSNQGKLNKSLKRRIDLLKKADDLANLALESGDWTSQVVVLTLVGLENKSFYEALLSLPVPEGLTAEQEQEYLQLLSSQASPHNIKAQDVSKKLEEFWANTSAVEGIRALPGTAYGSFANVIQLELQTIAEVAPEAQKTWIAALASKPLSVSTGAEVVSLQELEAARQAVRENPFALEKLQSLLKLEKRASRASMSPMVEYLEGRLKAETDKSGNY